MKFSYLRSNLNNISMAFLPTKVLKYRVAGILPIGPSLPPKLYEIVIGLILGDAYISRNKTENASLHIEQSIIHQDYVIHQYDLFKDYCK
jgi:LAGLIDADG DNA endonuclease family protein